MNWQDRLEKTDQLLAESKAFRRSLFADFPLQEALQEARQYEQRSKSLRRVIRRVKQG